ncbi:MAG TPA: S41 family peptidase [Candidatus Acidoferrum sp.]|nr:S41 family peptidase [Candidatus Acidoferrum sp.]
MAKSTGDLRPTKRFALWFVTCVAAITCAAGFVLGTRLGSFTAWLGSENKGLPAQLDYSQLQQVYDKLREKYDGPLDASKLLAGAEQGLVAAAGDPYTDYFTKAEAQQFLSSLNGTFSGIGIVIDKKDNQLVVVSTLDGSPAATAGLLASDKIIKVNDQDTSTWSIDQAVAAIRGDAGTSVKITVLRGQDFKDFSITRAQITAPSVTWQETSDNIGYMRISEFNNDTGSLADKAAQEFKDKKVVGVVLDLRGNGGGYVSAAQDVADLWLSNKVIVQERRGNQVIDTITSGDNPLLGGLPTVVLVDGGSASASEIVAGALHDNNVAKLVGVKTFGKGSVQDFVDMPGGADLKVTVAKWYTPAGKNISKEGIMPDFVVQLTDDNTKNGQDPQKDKAFSLVLHP